MSDQAYGFGGKNWTYDSYSTNVYRYDLSDNTWTAMTFCTYARQNFESGGSAYIDGYIFGGGGSPSGYKKTEKYDMAGNSWTIKTDQPQNDGGGSRPEPIGGHIYCGYPGNWKYDFAGDSWKGCPNIVGQDQAFGVGGKIYGASQNNSWSYDPSSDAKVAITSFPSGNYNGAGFGDGINGFICAGGASTYPNANVFRYNVSSDTWTQRADQGQAVNNNGTFVINGQGHSFCGYYYPNQSYNYHGRFDDSANTWTSKAGYPQSWAGVSGFYPLPNLPPSAPTGLSVSAT